MTSYYVDPAATSGNNDGSSQVNAWLSLQRAIDGEDGVQPTAGDKVLCRAQDGVIPDETLAARIDVDGGNGTTTNPLQITGVNSSWIEDGTQYVINGNNVATEILYFGASQYQKWLNFKVFGAIGYSIEFMVSGARMVNFINCWVSGGYGARFFRNSLGSVIRCLFENSSHGVYNLSGSLINSIVRNCSSDGVDSSYSASRIVGNIIYNSAKNIAGQSAGSLIQNNVIHGGTYGIYRASAVDALTILGNRITGASTAGIGAAGSSGIMAYNYLQNITDLSNADGLLQVALAGINTNIIGGTDTDYGYVDSANADFNLVTGATLREVLADIGLI